MSLGGVIICTQEPGDELKYKCRCCGIESDDIEDMAPGGFCWECALAPEGKPGCPSCIRMNRIEEENGATL